uniref:Serine racemase n=1 Tax=Romanomermis culicivorax TaxID=13658 RepID=A0A915J448_ROMCU
MDGETVAASSKKSEIYEISTKSASEANGSENRVSKFRTKLSRAKRSSSICVPQSDPYTKRLREHDVRRVMDTDEPSSALKIKFNETSYTSRPLPVDPWSDPDNPRTILYQDVSAAAYRIKNGITKTVCTRSNQLSTKLGMDIYFKKDFLQVTGSFKERGARNTLLQLDKVQRDKGVIAASAGNHALALSYHGQLLNIPVTVVMPVTAPLMKISLCRQYGADVIVYGEDLGESKEKAMNFAQSKGLLYINGYDHPHIIAGQGSMGIEIVDQVENVDAVVVPVGGAGLIAGVAVAVKHLCPSAKIIGVEAERCPSFTRALEAGKPVHVKPGSTTADGLSVPTVGYNAFETARRLVDKVVCVSEEFIALAILRLIEVEKAVVEGAGAIGLAALIAGLLPELQGKRVVLPLCGGNIDTTVLGRCIERGLAVDRRLVRFSVTVSDRPGGIAELAQLLCSCGASIKDILHERAWVKTDIFCVNVKLVVEIGAIQGILLVAALNETCESDSNDYYTCLRKNGLGMKPEEEHQIRLNTCSLQVGCKCADYGDTQSPPPLPPPFLAPSLQNDVVNMDMWKKCRDKVDEQILACVKNESSGVVFPQPPPVVNGSVGMENLPNCTDDQKTQIELCLLKSQPRHVNFIQKHNSDCRSNRQCFLLMKPECQKMLLDSQRKACKCTMSIQPMLQVQLCLNKNNDKGDDESREGDGLASVEEPDVPSDMRTSGSGREFGRPLFLPPPPPPPISSEACQMNDICREIPVSVSHHKRPYLPVVPTFPL